MKKKKENSFINKLIKFKEITLIWFLFGNQPDMLQNQMEERQIQNNNAILTLRNDT